MSLISVNEVEISEFFSVAEHILGELEAVFIDEFDGRDEIG